MLLLNPDIVRFESHAWEDVSALAIDRHSKHPIEDHGDQGPFAAFADAPDQSIHIKLQRTLRASDTQDPPLGLSGTLTFYLGTPGTDLDRRKVTITCTLISIKHDLPAGARPITKTLAFMATNPDGEDPVTIAEPTISE